MKKIFVKTVAMILVIIMFVNMIPESKTEAGLHIHIYEDCEEIVGSPNSIDETYHSVEVHSFKKCKWCTKTKEDKWLCRKEKHNHQQVSVYNSYSPCDASCHSVDVNITYKCTVCDHISQGGVCKLENHQFETVTSSSSGNYQVVNENQHSFIISGETKRCKQCGYTFNVGGSSRIENHSFQNNRCTQCGYERHVHDYQLIAEGTTSYMDYDDVYHSYETTNDVFGCSCGSMYEIGGSCGREEHNYDWSGVCCFCGHVKSQSHTHIFEDGRCNSCGYSYYDGLEFLGPDSYVDEDNNLIKITKITSDNDPGTGYRTVTAKTILRKSTSSKSASKATLKKGTSILVTKVVYSAGYGWGFVEKVNGKTKTGWIRMDKIQHVCTRFDDGHKPCGTCKYCKKQVCATPVDTYEYTVTVASGEVFIGRVIVEGVLTKETAAADNIKRVTSLCSTVSQNSIPKYGGGTSQASALTLAGTYELSAIAGYVMDGLVSASGFAVASGALLGTAAVFAGVAVVIYAVSYIAQNDIAKPVTLADGQTKYKVEYDKSPKGLTAKYYPVLMSCEGVALPQGSTWVVDFSHPMTMSEAVGRMLQPRVDTSFKMLIGNTVVPLQIAPANPFENAVLGAKRLSNMIKIGYSVYAASIEDAVKLAAAVKAVSVGINALNMWFPFEVNGASYNTITDGINSILSDGTPALVTSQKKVLAHYHIIDGAEKGSNGRENRNYVTNAHIFVGYPAGYGTTFPSSMVIW